MASILEIDDAGGFTWNIFADAPENNRKEFAKNLKLVNDKQYFI